MDSATNLSGLDAMAVELVEQAGVWEQLWGRRGDLADVVAQVLRERAPGRVVFTGCGDCHAAAEFAEAFLGPRCAAEVRGLPPMEISRARRHLLGPATLLVALSVSGRTPRVVEVIRAAHRAGAATLAITDDPSSAVATEAQREFRLGTAPLEAVRRTDYRDPEAAKYAGYHRAVPQTKSYGAMALGLAMVCLELERTAPTHRGTPAGDLVAALGTLPARAGAAAAAGVTAAELLRQRLHPGAKVTFCGTGLNAATARFAGYKLLELTCSGAHAEIEEFCHTHYLTTGLGDGVVFLVHDAGTAERAREIVPVLEGEIGAAAGILATTPIPPAGRGWAVPVAAVPPEVSPLLLAHAAGSLVRAVVRGWGINTDRFRAGRDEEIYVRGSTRMIRESRILDS